MLQITERVLKSTVKGLGIILNHKLTFVQHYNNIQSNQKESKSEQALQNHTQINCIVY
jgi:hypothetical protein